METLTQDVYASSPDSQCRQPNSPDQDKICSLHYRTNPAPQVQKSVPPKVQKPVPKVQKMDFEVPHLIETSDFFQFGLGYFIELIHIAQPKSIFKLSQGSATNTSSYEEFKSLSVPPKVEKPVPKVQKRDFEVPHLIETSDFFSVWARLLH